MTPKEAEELGYPVIVAKRTRGGAPLWAGVNADNQFVTHLFAYRKDALAAVAEWVKKKQAEGER